MERKNEIMRMWRECFDDASAEWLKMFFNDVYDEDDLLVAADDNGKVISSLLLQPYFMSFGDTTMQVSYLCGAATLPRYRGLGSMRTLLHKALLKSYSQGDYAILLIPAADWLRYYYESAGNWATMFYNHIVNYTSVHQFPSVGYREMVVDKTNLNLIYESFRDFERSLSKSVVLHSLGDFHNVLSDTVIEGGYMTAAVSEDGAVRALAIASLCDQGEAVKVKVVVGDSHDACQAALEYVRRHYPDKRITITFPVTDCYEKTYFPRNLTPFGMLRVVNVKKFLDLICFQLPKNYCRKIRVTDPYIQENNNTYILRRGSECVVDTSGEPLHMPYDFDVTVDVLAKMIFGSKETGRIIDFPSVRPVMNLMLE